MSEPKAFKGPNGKQIRAVINRSKKFTREELEDFNRMYYPSIDVTDPIENAVFQSVTQSEWKDLRGVAWNAMRYQTFGDNWGVPAVAHRRLYLTVFALRARDRLSEEDFLLLTSHWRRVIGDAELI